MADQASPSLQVIVLVSYCPPPPPMGVFACWLGASECNGGFCLASVVINLEIEAWPKNKKDVHFFQRVNCEL